jgi:NSS family neurotransmitter:Na+ symporter
MVNERFSGRLAAWLAMVGVAIGLGNVWRFPYMMGQHGGSAFLLVYAALALLLAMPVLAAEWALGRALRAGPVPTFRASFGRHAGLIIGVALVSAIVVADSYYIVIIANIVHTAAYGLVMGFDPEASAGQAAGLNDGVLQYALALLVLAAVCWVMALGVRGGIERFSRWFVPAFGVVVLYLVVNALLLDGVWDKLLMFLRPDFSLLGATDVFAAMGQAVFSLGVGGTIMLVYGGYLDHDTPIISTALATALGDMAGALLAALFIVPSVLYFGLDMAAGPGLVFSTLPKLFAVMPGGRWLGVAFLAAFVLMAFLSALAALEVGLVGLRDLGAGRWSRQRMALILFAVEAVLMLPSALWPSIIGTLDMIFGSGMQTLGALAAVLALGWSASRNSAMEQLFAHGAGRWQEGFVFWLRWVVPAALLAIAVLFVREHLRQGGA